MNAQERAVMQQALAFTMRDFATVRDFEAARAVLHDALRAALAQEEPLNLADPAVRKRLISQGGYGLVAQQDLYWRLHKLSKVLEELDIDEHDHPNAVATILDAMALVQQASSRWDGDHNIESPWNACMHREYCMSLKAEQVQKPVVGWMDPASGDVISTAQRVVWNEDFGQAGQRKAALFTVPLRACNTL